MHSTEPGQWKQYLQEVFGRYSPLEESTVDALLSLCQPISVKKGTSLLNIGATSRYLYILVEGAVVSYYLGDEGQAYHKNIFLEGDFVGSTVSAIKQEPSDFGLETIQPCQLLQISYRGYRELMETQLDLKNFYVAYLEQNWVIQKEKREVEMVLLDAGQRYADFLQKHPGIENRVPLHYIASHLGITPTQLSRIRKKR
ncbi:Crp/Fnr family transcriptional regulator [bacterium SCSIO 12741]|nr:Crp/Fnr family transcriptional regulator [bacterium SCSIO 12741]